MSMGKVIVGIGEILWDRFPDHKTLGGAPTNFAYHASALGNTGIVVSRLGTDELGREARSLIRSLKLDDRNLQNDSEHATGTVEVALDENGIPDYTIKENVAWDFIEWNEELSELANNTNAVCYGTLAQRSSVSRTTIQEFLKTVSNDTLRVFDINLRQHFYSREIIENSLGFADVLKLNDDEIDTVSELLSIKESLTPENKCRLILETFGLNLVCATLGSVGSILVSKEKTVRSRGYSVKVEDTVGAGDAFTAALIHHLLKGTPFKETNERCNRYAAWVASKRGGTPETDTGVIKAVK